MAIRFFPLSFVQMTTFFLVVLSPVPSLPAQDISVRISPVPLAPGGKLPDVLNGQFVYLKPETQELLVVPDLAGLGTSPITIGLHNQATSQVTSHVSTGVAGGYTYQYGLNSASTSQRPLQEWSLLIPADDSKFAAVAPTNWSMQLEETTMIDRPAPGNIPLRYVHFFAASGAEISASGRASGFRLVSSNLPGYVTSFTRSKVQTTLTAEALMQVSPAVQSIVTMATAPEWDSQLAWKSGLDTFREPKLS